MKDQYPKYCECTVSSHIRSFVYFVNTIVHIVGIFECPSQCNFIVHIFSVFFFFTCTNNSCIVIVLLSVYFATLLPHLRHLTFHLSDDIFCSLLIRVGDLC